MVHIFYVIWMEYLQGLTDIINLLDNRLIVKKNPVILGM